MNTVRVRSCFFSAGLKIQLGLVFCISTLLAAGCVANQPVSDSVQSVLPQAVSRVEDQLTPDGTAYSYAYLPDARQFSIHLAWPNHWIQSSGIAVASQLGIDLMSSGGCLLYTSDAADE